MEKFWKLMSRIGYGIEYWEGRDKRMLIGFMIEYIRDHKYWTESKDQPFPVYEMEFRMSVWGKNHYECFEEIIEYIDGVEK